jgi:membrane protein DedA with SNARE-associated domain
MDLISREMLDGVVAFMRTHHLWAAPILFVIMALEGLILTTFIFSGSVMIVAAGVMIQSGVTGYWPVFIAISAGFWLGDWLNFETGRKGEDWFRGLKTVQNNPALLSRAENMLSRWGTAAIFISRFLGPIRPFVTFLAGTCHMRPYAFHVATVASTLILTAGLLNAGMTGIQLWDAYRR